MSSTNRLAEIASELQKIAVHGSGAQHADEAARGISKAIRFWERFTESFDGGLEGEDAVLADAMAVSAQLFELYANMNSVISTLQDLQRNAE